MALASEQVTDRYGRQADTVANNHRGRLALAGIADLGTAEVERLAAAAILSHIQPNATSPISSI